MPIWLQEGTVLPALNKNSTKFYTGTVLELGLVVDVKEFLEEKDSWLRLEIYFAKKLETDSDW